MASNILNGVMQLGKGLLTSQGAPAPYRSYPQQSLNVTPVGADENAMPMANYESQVLGGVGGLVRTQSAAAPSFQSGPAVPQQYTPRLGTIAPSYPTNNQVVSIQSYPNYPTLPDVTPQRAANETASALQRGVVPYMPNSLVGIQQSKQGGTVQGVIALAKRILSPTVSAQTAGPVPSDSAPGVFPDEQQTLGTPMTQQQVDQNALAQDAFVRNGVGTPSQQAFLSGGDAVPNNPQDLVPTVNYGAMGTGGIYHVPNGPQVMLPNEAGMAPIGGALDLYSRQPNSGSVPLPSDMAEQPFKLAQSTNPDPAKRAQEQAVGAASIAILQGANPSQMATNLLASNDPNVRKAANVALQYILVTTGPWSTLPSRSGVGALTQGGLQAAAKDQYAATKQPVQLSKSGAFITNFVSSMISNQPNQATNVPPAAAPQAALKLQSPSLIPTQTGTWGGTLVDRAATPGEQAWFGSLINDIQQNNVASNNVQVMSGGATIQIQRPTINPGSAAYQAMLVGAKPAAPVTQQQQNQNTLSQIASQMVTLTPVTGGQRQTGKVPLGTTSTAQTQAGMVTLTPVTGGQSQMSKVLLGSGAGGQNQGQMVTLTPVTGGQQQVNIVSLATAPTVQTQVNRVSLGMQTLSPMVLTGQAQAQQKTVAAAMTTLSRVMPTQPKAATPAPATGLASLKSHFSTGIFASDWHPGS